MATRVLSPTEKRELDIAFTRKQQGNATPTDVANLNYAQSRQLWSPTTPATLTNPVLPNNGLQNAGDRSLNLQPPSPQGSPLPQSGGQSPSPQGSPQSPDLNASWQSAMAGLIKQYQAPTNGPDENLQKDRNALIQARFGAQTNPLTEEQLRTLTPSAQEAIRSRNANGIETQLGGVDAALKSREQQRTELQRVMENAQNRLADLQKEERAAHKGVSVSQGETIIDPVTGKVIFQGAPKATEHSPIYKEWQDAVSAGYTGGFIQYQNEDQNRQIRKASLGGESDNKILSVNDAQALGVPYGTTVGQAKLKGIIPSDLTNSTKTMVEAAPNVLRFVDKIEKELTEANAGLGPAASRWREFKAGKVGLADPAFTQIRTNVGLLTTLLMRMHVGARGGEYIMKHFQDLIDSSKQSPDNLISALNEVKDYASSIVSEGKGGSVGNTPDSFNKGAEPKNSKELFKF